MTPHDFLDQILTRLPLDKDSSSSIKRHAQTFIALCTTGKRDWTKCIFHQLFTVHSDPTPFNQFLATGLILQLSQDEVIHGWLVPVHHVAKEHVWFTTFHIIVNYVVSNQYTCYLPDLIS